MVEEQTPKTKDEEQEPSEEPKRYQGIYHNQLWEAGKYVEGTSAEVIVEKLFRLAKIFVMPVGKEFMVTPLTQLDKLIPDWGNSEKSIDPRIDAKSYISAFPDFVVATKTGKQYLIECKNRINASVMYNEFFQWNYYPVMVCVTTSQKPQLEFNKPHYTEERSKELLKSHVHVRFLKDPKKPPAEDNLEVFTFREFLLQFCDVKEEEILDLDDETINWFVKMMNIHC